MNATVALPGKVDRMLRDSNYPTDRPDIWARYRANLVRGRAGKGYRVAATLSLADWRDIADHLQSVADCLADMQPHERASDGASELRAARAALVRIGDACGVKSGEPWVAR